MYFEILGLSVLYIYVLNKTKVIDIKKCINDNVGYLKKVIMTF